MPANSRGIRIASAAIAAAGVVFLALNILLQGKLDFTLPLIFLMLGPGFVVLVFALRERWRCAPLFYIPGGLFSAFGVIFLLNVLTGDWQAWAYAWLLALSGAAVGTVLAAAAIPLPRPVLLAGLWAAAGSLTLFGVFGAIAGGWLIRVLAPLLLLSAGVALRFWRSGWLEKLDPPAAGAAASAGATPASVPAGQPQAEAPGAGANRSLAEPLSARELEVLRLIDQGLSNQEIAERLTVAPSTIKTHINNIYGKLGVQTRAQCIIAARRLKIV